MKSKKKRSKAMSRTEAFARQLIKLYKCQVKICQHDDGCLLFKKGDILIKPSSSSISWNDIGFLFSQVLTYHNWNEVLFGSNDCESLTDAIKNNAAIHSMTASRNRKKLLLDFKTLDELDILLTLAGYNQVSA